MMTMQAGFYTILLIIFLKYDVVISIADKYDNGIIEREDLNVFFQPRTPWLGGDVALSIPLLNHNFLWVWGDTLVGNITPNGHRNIQKMMHDSFSIVNVERNTINNFIPKKTNGFLKPPNTTSTPSSAYYWVVAGLFIEKLFFLSMKIEASNSSIGFKQVSTDVIIVDNFQHSFIPPPTEWLYRSQSIPNSKEDSNCTWNEGIALANEDGEAIVPNRSSDKNQYVYIFGKCTWSTTRSGAALSRIHKKDLLHFSSFTNNSNLFEYFSVNDTWTTDFEIVNLKMLFPSDFSEGNLVYNTFLNSWYILLCQASDPIVHIALSNSKSIYKNNWKVSTFYNISKKYLNKTEGLISYASKSHPEYAPGGDDRYIVFSFNTNTLNGIKALDSLNDVYHPHFIQVDLMKYDEFEMEKNKFSSQNIFKRRRQLLAPVRDSVAAEMGILPAKFHHKTSSNDAKSVKSNADGASGNSNSNNNNNGGNKPPSISASGAAGPRHSNAVSPSEIALGISGMNSHDGEDTNDCKDKGGIVTLLCHSSKNKQKQKDNNNANNNNNNNANENNDNNNIGNKNDNTSSDNNNNNNNNNNSDNKDTTTGTVKKSEDSSIDKMAVRDVTVHVETTKGSFQMTVKPKWSPQGAAQFLSLVAAGFYENVAIFRVLPGFVAQFGINGDPKIQKQYGSTISDDPPAHISNSLGTVSFAAHGPNSRSTQVFFNIMDNARLDAMNFQPFAVVPRKSFDIITSFYGKYGETINQGRIFQEGNSFLKMNYPKLDYIIKMSIIELGN